MYSTFIGASVGALGSILGLFVFRELDFLPKILIMISSSVFVFVFGMMLLAKNAKMKTVTQSQ